MAASFMFKGPASLTGASTISTSGAITTSGLITAGTLDLGNGGKVAASISTTTGTGDDVLATQAYVLANAGGGSAHVNIISTGTTALAANTTYFISAGGGAVTMTCTLLGLSAGDVVRFVAESVGGGNITLSAATAIYNIVGGSATNLVLDAQGQGLQFVFKAGALWLVGGGYSSSS
jgi:hypothetical protein